MKFKIYIIVLITGILTMSSCRSTSKPCGLAKNPINTYQKTINSLFVITTKQVS